jgi:hypothetical protein
MRDSPARAKTRKSRAGAGVRPHRQRGGSALKGAYLCKISSFVYI